MFLYLAEAHSHENWPLSLQAPRSHPDAIARAAAVKALLAKYPDFSDLLHGRVYTDTMNNTAALTYGLWPERYLLLEGDTVRWASTLSFEERMADLPQQLRAAASTLWTSHHA